jgi:hypothetical protein
MARGRLNVHWIPTGVHGSKNRVASGGLKTNFVALKMLVADRAKYFGLILAIAQAGCYGWRIGRQV